MTDTTIATVGELIAALDHYDPAAPVRIAIPPDYAESASDPLECPLSQVLLAQVDTDQSVVWIGVGDPHLGCLPAPVTDALGWS
ncbi:hypothetical protein [Amycolatopsis keratiniphila]|uniref:hypothetical protein n=1 Tax=Amycolatopsis keratiniphila TaxID=129921 RepID=UPI00087B2965|nr:hypothetical protein [Amycolatopsis keratiniphila]OLZ59526.1 hypothetical protein BS330_03775 [Amycolatopsis keratiniphila subsp. nogabecina]SDU53636.1 hypothetical protein SAMN04489733_5663 [Amycolatopsis keratiniphila]